MRSLSEIRERLGGDDGGLTSAAAAESRRTYGANRLSPLRREPAWKKLLAKFDEPIIKILLAAALLSMIVELFEVSPTLGGLALGFLAAGVAAAFILHLSRWLPTFLFVTACVLFVIGLAAGQTLQEGLAVMVAVVLATGVAFASEYRSDREFEALNAQKESLRAKVLRDGAFHTLPQEEVVVGDLVLLEMGDEIPADGRLVQATELLVDQSLMTGESEGVPKRAVPDDSAEGFDHPGCVYRGTQVKDGVGRMVVAEVGDTSYLGRIARRLSADDEDEEPRTAAAAAGPDAGEERVKRKLTISKELTPLQLKLQHLATLISRVGYTAAVLIFLALVVRGVWFADPPEVFWPHDREQGLHVAEKLLHYFVYMVIIIVVAVPEGLPMSVAVSLSLAMRKMTRANSLVRQLVACETIGSATIICSDKTGTLTQNRMTLVRLGFAGRTVERGSPDWPRLPALADLARDPRPVARIALNAAVNATANLEEREGRTLVAGSSTEGALLEWLRAEGLSYTGLRQCFPLLYTLHFSSDRKRMTSVVRLDGRLVTLVKGAPEWLLENSTAYLDEQGREHPWTPEARAAALEALRAAARQAMRTLAFGYALLPEDTPADEDALHARRDELERGLVYAGMAAIRDPLRDDVAEAVNRCRSAGIRVMMITGDNVETARAIAADIGLLADGDGREPAGEVAAETVASAHVLTSAALAEKDDDEVKALLPHLRVLARARPLDKYRIVKLLQQLGQVVAVTGDGTNDAPALKQADVGLSMGLAGTEVAKEASKIVLLDDAFSTIVKAVHWGRALYENLQRFLQFQLTINVSALVIAFLGPFFGIRPPFTVLQLLWINVIMDTFAAIALCSEPPREAVMRQPPKRRDESILTRSMLVTLFTTAAFFVVVMMTLLAGMEWRGWFQGAGPVSDEFAPLTVRQVSIFFTTYVFFQIWNQVNCRSLTPEVSGLAGLTRNPTFLTVALITALVQVSIVSVPALAAVFKVAPLGLADWLAIVAGTASVLVFAELIRLVRLALRRA